MQQRNAKPLGLVLVVLYTALSGLTSLFASGLVLLASAIPGVPLWIGLFGFFLLIYTLLLFASVYGLWSLQAWGFNLAMFIYLVSIPIGLLAIFPILPDSQFSTFNTIYQLIGIAISVLVLWYLSRPNYVFPNF